MNDTELRPRWLRIIFDAAVISVLVAISWFVWFLLGWLDAKANASRAAYYESCFDRGGTITEDPWGRACVGITKP
jgi:hypothetical protein